MKRMVLMVLGALVAVALIYITRTLVSRAITNAELLADKEYSRLQ